MNPQVTRFEELEFQGPDRGIDELTGLRILVLGLGTHGGGTDLIQFLHSRGALITVSDAAPRSQIADSIELIEPLVPAERIHTDGHQDHHLNNIDWVVVNPAIPPLAPFLKKVRESKVRPVTELGLFLSWVSHSNLAAITGTNGKSTVCALTRDMLQSSGIPVQLGGNFGGSLLLQLESAPEETRWIVEVSSFQASRLGNEIPRPPLVALTSFAPDHLDWHGDQDTYFHAKMNLLQGPHQRPSVVIVAEESPFKSAIEKLSEDTRIISFSPFGSPGKEIDPETSPALEGTTGQFNRILAQTLAQKLGATEEACRQAATQFNGLPHRFEFVAKIDGVTYINDSKATTPDAALSALNRIEGPIHWLCGGKDKGISLKELAHFCAKKEIQVYAFGESAQNILNALADSPSCTLHQFTTLEEAFVSARLRSQAGETLLCSPAYPSFDQYQSFEQRGEQFRTLVTGTSSTL